MSRIADVLEKAWEQGRTPDAGQPVIEPATGQLGRSPSEILIPWQLEADNPSGGEPPKPFRRRVASESSNSAPTVQSTGVPPDRVVSFRSTNASPDENEGTVAQILAPAFAHSWSEAVAIVQEVASKVGRGVSVPAPEHLVVDQRGRISFASRNDSNEDPVVSLAVLLGWLVQGTDPPPALARLVAENACAKPQYEKVKTFSHALSSFERAKRSRELRAVAERLHARASGPAYPIVERLAKNRIIRALRQREK
jgi:hypothetical protein